MCGVLGMVQCRASLLHKQHKHKQNSIKIGFEYLAGELRIREQSKIKNFCPSRARVSRLGGCHLSRNCTLSLSERHTCTCTCTVSIDTRTQTRVHGAWGRHAQPKDASGTQFAKGTRGPAHRRAPNRSLRPVAGEGQIRSRTGRSE